MIQDAKKKMLHFLTAKKQVLRFYFYLLVKFSGVTGAISDFVDSITFFLHRTLVERVVIKRGKRENVLRQRARNYRTDKDLNLNKGFFRKAMKIKWKRKYKLDSINLSLPYLKLTLF